MARALEVPMYQLFHEGAASESVRKLKLPRDNDEWGTMGATADYLYKLRRLLAKMEPNEQKLLLHVSQKVARQSGKN
jgi:hypothetical protein